MLDLSKDHHSSTLLIKRLINHHIKPYLGKIALAIFFMIIVAGTSTMNVWMIKPAIDKIFLKQDSTMLLYVPLIVIIISTIQAFASYMQNYLMKYVGQRVITDMQIKLYHHLIHADIEFLTTQSSGRLISRFTNDIVIMRGAVSNLLTGLVKESLTVIFLIILMFYQSVVLSLIAFTVFPLAIVPIIKLGKRMRKISHHTQEELGHYSSQLDDSFQSIKIIKSYVREEFEVNRAEKLVEKIFKLYVKAIKTDSISSPIMEMLSGIAIAAVIWYGGTQVINGVTTAGGFFAFIVAFITAYKPIKTLSNLNNNLQEGLAAARRIFALLDIKPKITDLPNSKDLYINDKIKFGEIKFEEVEFSYPNGKKSLNKLSFIAPAGKMIALVGSSGGGKSTIINLINRFYDPENGIIYINNQNINQVTLKSLRENIAVVTQEIMLFDDTIMANIAYGNLNANKEEIIEAAKIADAHEFIANMPDGYNTLIGQHGFKLSGGQRQRLSLARAILKNSPILILDEATSALDSITERKIQESLFLYRKNRTTIIIAHRLSTIIDADIIYVIKNGAVLEYGNHQELLEKNGEYSELYKKDVLFQ